MFDVVFNELDKLVIGYQCMHGMEIGIDTLTIRC